MPGRVGDPSHTGKQNKLCHRLTHPVVLMYTNSTALVAGVGIASNMISITYWNSA